MRSLLLVSCNDPDALAVALDSGADALVLDLEAAGSNSGRETARNFIMDARRQQRRLRIFVRINGLDTDQADLDLDAVMPAGPDGIVLARSRSGADVQHLGAKLAVHEAQNGLPDGACAILPIVTQTAVSLFGLSSYVGASPRLIGLAWSAQDFAVALGASAFNSVDGYTAPCQLARTLTLVGARAAAVEPIDTAFDGHDEAELRRECEAARRDGFTAKIALDAAQVRIINEAFKP